MEMPLKKENKSERETGMGGGGVSGGGGHVLQFFWQGDSLKVQTFHVLGCLKETGRISPFPLTGVTSYQEAAAACAGGGAAAPPASPARLSPATRPSAALSVPAAPSPAGGISSRKKVALF